jgi:hypothetical protein
VDLPVPGKATDENEPDPSCGEVTRGQGEQLPRHVRGIAVALGVAGARHLRPDEPPVGDMVVLEGRHPGASRELGVPAEECRAEFRGAESLQVHGEERGVVQPVDRAQPVVELQAVQDLWPSGR